MLPSRVKSPVELSINFCKYVYDPTLIESLGLFSLKISLLSSNTSLALTELIKTSKIKNTGMVVNIFLNLIFPPLFVYINVLYI